MSTPASSISARMVSTRYVLGMPQLSVSPCDLAHATTSFAPVAATDVVNNAALTAAIASTPFVSDAVNWNGGGNVTNIATNNVWGCRQGSIVSLRLRLIFDRTSGAPIYAPSALPSQFCPVSDLALFPVVISVDGSHSISGTLQISAAPLGSISIGEGMLADSSIGSLSFPSGAGKFYMNATVTYPTTSMF